MPRTDRYWWLQSLFGLVFAVISVIVSVSLDISSLPLDEELSESITNDLLLSLGLFLIFLALGMAFAVGSIRARHRNSLRRHAIGGDAEAVPLAAGITAHPERAPDISLSPLVMEWHATNRMRVLYLPFLGFVFLIVLLELGALAGLGAYEYITNLHSTLMTDTRLFAGAVALVGIVGFVALLMPVRRLLRFVRGRPYGVTATDEGVTTVAQFGTQKFIPWNEMRLFEVVATQPFSPIRMYYLRGKRGWATWQDDPSKYGQVAPYNVSPSEMAQRLQALIDLIAARTGLQPRSFSKALQPPRDRVRQSNRSGRVSVVAVLMVFALITLGISALTYLAPATSSQLLTSIVAGSLAFCAISLIYLAFKVLLADHSGQKKQEAEPIPASEANVPDIPDAVYELVTGYRWPARILMTLWGLALCVNFLPSVVLPLAASFHNLFSPDTLPIAPTAPPYLRGVALMLYGVVGIFLLVFRIRGVNVSIRLDAAGLSRGRRGNAYVLLIANVGAVVARVSKGALISYQVLDTNEQLRIDWPARPGRVLTKRTSRSAQAVSPDKLATLVAKRSGKTIEQRGVGER